MTNNSVSPGKRELQKCESASCGLKTQIPLSALFFSFFKEMGGQRERGFSGALGY